MSQDQDIQLEKTRARYGLLAVVISNVAITGVAIFGVWRLDGDKSVIIGVLSAAFTAVSSMTTAYLGIKAVSNTAKSIAASATSAAQAPAPAPAQAPAAAPTAATAAPAPAAPAVSTTPTATPGSTPPAQRGQ
ncbi:hypothetical protein [Streptomyces sp. NPDC048277]|uniref:hypothetical protein n=1 Tax=Streptomyces sp. NPDC048277 TaxID=3155027 RepID=UPI00340B8EB7